MERLEVRWHGRGGQGAVTAAVLVAEAAIIDGKYAQAYPEFGAERRGAPVVAYSRFSDSPILTRSPILNPDVVVVLDTSIDKSIYTNGLKEGGTIILNSSKDNSEILSTFSGVKAKIAKVNATKIALDTLGSAIVNTAMVGAFVKMFSVASLDSLNEAILETFSKKVAERNIEAVKRAYGEVEIVN